MYLAAISIIKQGQKILKRVGNSIKTNRTCSTVLCESGIQNWACLICPQMNSARPAVQSHKNFVQHSNKGYKHALTVYTYPGDCMSPVCLTVYTCPVDGASKQSVCSTQAANYQVPALP